MGLLDNRSIDQYRKKLALEMSHPSNGYTPTQEEINTAIDVGMGRQSADVAYGEEGLLGGTELGRIAGMPVSLGDVIPTGSLAKLAMMGGTGLAALGGTMGLMSKMGAGSVPSRFRQYGGLFDLTGLDNRGRDLIQSKAEQYAEKLKSAGVNVMDVQHSGSAAGPSSYIKIHGQPDLRISGHSKGVFNSQGVINIGSDQELDDILTQLPKTVYKATQEQIAKKLAQQKQIEIETMYPIRIKNAEKKIAKGKTLTASEQEAMDWKNLK